MQSETTPVRLARMSATAALLAAAGALAWAAPPAAAGPGCARANAGIGEATAKQLAKAVRCLINEERADRGRSALGASGKLGVAANRHNRAMLDENCWRHECPGERPLGERIRASGYLDGARRWRYAEIFGCDATPSAMLATWLAARFSRSQIRDGRFRDIGVAALRERVPAAPGCDEGNEVTYTVVFAFRAG